MSQGLSVRPAFDLRVRDWEHVALFDLAWELKVGHITIDMRTGGKCLGSLVARFAAPPRDPAVYMGLVYSPALRELYWPGMRPDGSIDYTNPGWNATPRQAASAILNFLTEGMPRWKAVMNNRYSAGSAINAL